MKNRLLYGSALVALMITVTLVIWQGSFDFGGYGPNGPEQTYIFWAIWEERPLRIDFLAS